MEWIGGGWEEPMDEPGTNPYAPPAAVEPEDQALARAALLHIETDLRGHGAILLGQALLAVPVWILCMVLLNTGAGAHWLQWAAAMVLGVAGVLFGVVGVGLRRLRPWARWPSVFAGLASLLFPPLGWLTGPFLIWRALSPDGVAVLTDAHVALRADSESMQPAISWSSLAVAALYVGFGLLGLGLVAVALVAMAAGS